jgi:WD40 repeat protein
MIPPLNNPVLRNGNICYSIPSSPFVEFAPIDILRLICSHLNAHDLLQLASANKYLYTLIDSESSLWNSLLRKCFPKSHLNSQSKINTPLEVFKHLTHVENNMKTGTYQLQMLTGHQNWVNNILVQGKQLISASEDHTIKIWDQISGKEWKELQAPVAAPGRLGISKISVHGDQLIAVLADHTVKIWDLKSGEVLQTPEGYQRGIKDIIVHRDKLIALSVDLTIKIWDLKNGQELKTPLSDQGSVCNILVCEKKLIAVLSDRTIKIWDLEGDQELQTVTNQNLITRIVVHGNQLILSSVNGSINIWDRCSGKELHTLTGHKSWINSMLTDGNHLISASEDHTIKIWDLDSGEELLTLRGHKGPINSILVHGDKLISASNDRTIKIWDLKNGKELQSLQGHKNSVLKILMDGDKLISASKDCTIKIWDFSFFPLSTYPKQLVEKNLSILGEMARAEYDRYPDIALGFAEKLDSAFRERLNEHAFKVGTPSTYSAEVILRVQTEVCVEALLHAIHDKDQARVSELLNQLVTIDPQNGKIYSLLWEVCGSDKSVRWGWGELAFHNKEECTATLLQKQQATVLFKNHFLSF